MRKRNGHELPFLFGALPDGVSSTQKRHGTICAIAALENIFDKYGYHVLDKALRMLVSTWEGEMYSLSGNTLNAVARLIAAYGDALNEETFKERLGLVSMKTIIRPCEILSVNIGLP